LEEGTTVRFLIKEVIEKFNLKLDPQIEVTAKGDYIAKVSFDGSKIIILQDFIKLVSKGIIGREEAKVILAHELGHMIHDWTRMYSLRIIIIPLIISFFAHIIINNVLTVLIICFLGMYLAREMMLLNEILADMFVISCYGCQSLFRARKSVREKVLREKRKKVKVKSIIILKLYKLIKTLFYPSEKERHRILRKYCNNFKDKV